MSMCLLPMLCSCTHVDIPMFHIICMLSPLTLPVLCHRSHAPPRPATPITTITCMTWFPLHLACHDVQEIDVAGGKKAIVIFVPYRLHKRFQKIQSRLIRELEKKFSGKHVSIVAQRTILSKQVSSTMS